MLLLGGAVGACSLLDPASRPKPGAPANLWCALEYRPAETLTGAAAEEDPTGQARADLRFTAFARPYDSTTFMHSPLDLLIHGVFAPGRHLSEPLEVEGAVCEGVWQAGKRVGQRVRASDDVFCRRQGREAVRIRAQTKHGVCEVVLPEGDLRPRCQTATRDHMPRQERELLRIFGRPCADPAPGLIWDPERG